LRKKSTLTTNFTFDNWISIISAHGTFPYVGLLLIPIHNSTVRLFRFDKGLSYQFDLSGEGCSVLWVFYSKEGEPLVDDKVKTHTRFGVLRNSYLFCPTNVCRALHCNQPG
jgi:hypothetical protein